MAATDVDVVVVGAGAMGSASALRLARSGRDVVLLERFGAGHDRGSSHGATRIFRVAYRDPRYVQLAMRSLELWRELEAETGVTLLEQVGQIDHGTASAIEEIAANLREAGRPFELLDPADAAERWPGFRFDDAVLHSPDGGRCWAERTVDASWRAARGHGAHVRFECPVERIDVSGDRATVHTAEGSWRAPVVVVAAGSWVGQLLGSLVPLPPLVVESEQPSHFRPLVHPDDRPSFLHHRGVAHGDGGPLRFDAYGLATPGEGVKVGGHGTSKVVDPDRRDRTPDPDLTAPLVRYVREWLPGLDPEPVSTTTCLFTTTPDDHFVLDRRGPLIVCSPCSGHGFKFVPAIAEQVELLALGGAQDTAAWRLPAA